MLPYTPEAILLHVSGRYYTPFLPLPKLREVFFNSFLVSVSPRFFLSLPVAIGKGLIAFRPPLDSLLVYIREPQAPPPLERPSFSERRPPLPPLRFSLYRSHFVSHLCLFFLFPPPPVRPSQASIKALIPVFASNNHFVTLCAGVITTLGVLNLPPLFSLHEHHGLPPFRPSLARTAGVLGPAFFEPFVHGRIPHFLSPPSCPSPADISSSKCSPSPFFRGFSPSPC